MSNTNTDPSNTPLPSIVLTGFSSSNSYDLHRPSYYPPAVSYLLTSLGLSKNHGAKVLDMAAGTGKFTEILAAQSEQFDIVAVEPHDEMRGVLIAKALPRTKVLGGDAQSVWTSEEWLALTGDGNWTPDSIVVAQAFHWFSTIGALRGLHKALPANGTLGLIWNVEDYNQSRKYSCTTHWESVLRDLLISYEDGMPRYRDNVWPAVFDTDDARELFSASATGDKVIEEKIFPVTIYLTKENLWNRIGTLSYVRGLDKIEGEMQRFRLGFDEILDNDESVVRNEKGEIEMHYIVHVVWTWKRS